MRTLNGFFGLNVFNGSSPSSSSSGTVALSSFLVSVATACGRGTVKASGDGEQRSDSIRQGTGRGGDD